MPISKHFGFSGEAIGGRWFWFLSDQELFGVFCASSGQVEIYWFFIDLWGLLLAWIAEWSLRLAGGEDGRRWKSLYRALSEKVGVSAPALVLTYAEIMGIQISLLLRSAVGHGALAAMIPLYGLTTIRIGQPMHWSRMQRGRLQQIRFQDYAPLLVIHIWIIVFFLLIKCIRIHHPHIGGRTRSRRAGSIATFGRQRLLLPWSMCAQAVVAIGLVWG